jgi:tetraacyldisaccharide 4'-kinase
MRGPDTARLVEGVWYGDHPSARLLSLVLAPLGWLYLLVARGRRWAYQSGLLPSASVPVPVIVVGNVTAGGTGKTPVVLWLVDFLVRAGFRPGIVSRGYGGRAGAGPHRVQLTDDAGVVGDEPLLMARRGPWPVCVGSDRVAAARALVQAGVNVIVADDGLQHYRLRRDLEIAVVDGERGLGNGRGLPAGPLRESADRMQCADLVLVNGDTPGLAPGQLNFRTTISQACLPDGSGARPLHDFAGQVLRIIAGIGNPRRFLQALASHGVSGEVLDVADHGRVSAAIMEVNGAPPLLMTEKDAVKYTLPADGTAWVVPLTVWMPAAVEQRILACLASRRDAAGTTTGPR